MDPLSQAALGAMVAQAAGTRTLGHRAAVVGAVAGALPDVDVLFSLDGDYFDQLVTHRGITHSLFFAPVVGPALGWVIWRWQNARGKTPTDRARPADWMVVATLALLSHPLLDYLTPYGTQLLAPFSNQRFALSAMPIVDPIYTTVLLVGIVAALRFRAAATRVAMVALMISSAYLGYGWAINESAEHLARNQLARDGVRDVTVAAFPTILQLHYRRVVARTDDTDRVGFVTLWEPCEIHWQSAARMDRERITPFLATREGAVFDWFTMGWAHYRMDTSPGRQQLVATDLRYGFSAQPAHSFFAATVPLGADGQLSGPVVGGRWLSSEQDSATVAALTSVFGRVLRAAYQSVCSPGAALTADAAAPIS